MQKLSSGIVILKLAVLKECLLTSAKACDRVGLKVHLVVFGVDDQMEVCDVKTVVCCVRDALVGNSP